MGAAVLQNGSLGLFRVRRHRCRVSVCRESAAESQSHRRKPTYTVGMRAVAGGAEMFGTLRAGQQEIPSASSTIPPSRPSTCPTSDSFGIPHELAEK
jgi:hypothetical protein